MQACRHAHCLVRHALCLLWIITSCAVVTRDHRIVRTSDGQTLSMQEQALALSEADVVFLGEEHDATVAHRLQLELSERLMQMHGIITISMEMFERDSQNMLDLYLAGSIDEETFLDLVRAWPNYPEDYAPAIELAKANGLPVLAANCYRPIAARAARSGLSAAIGSPWAALQVDASPGPYRERFFVAMRAAGVHQQDVSMEALERIYASQCLKDDTMAESIARYFDEHGPDAPPVVHWCGRFHSDFGQGTVERLRRRRPDLKIAIVSASKDAGLGRNRPLTDNGRADYLWFVRP